MRRADDGLDRPALPGFLRLIAPRAPLYRMITAVRLHGTFRTSISIPPSIRCAAARGSDASRHEQTRRTLELRRINLNCGCPSTRADRRLRCVPDGGAGIVADCVQAMRSRVGAGDRQAPPVDHDAMPSFATSSAPPPPAAMCSWSMRTMRSSCRPRRIARCRHCATKSCAS